MWDALGDSLKIFIEKHLIPSVISLVAGIVSILILPDGFWMIQKIGTIWVGVLAAGICFLLVEFIIAIAVGIRKIASKISNQKYRRKRDEEEENENIHKLWERVDRFSPGDRQILKNFLDSNNAPLEESASVWYNYDSLFESGWLVSTVVPYEPSDNNISPPKVNEYGIPYSHFVNTGKKKYRLKDDIYQILKYSKEKYGRISNFE